MLDVQGVLLLTATSYEALLYGALSAHRRTD